MSQPPGQPARRSEPPAVAEIELASRLKLAIGRIARRARLDSNELPPLQLSTLVTIAQCGPLRLGELAQREAVTAPTMTRVLAALDSRQLIERQPDPDDARSVRVTASAAGGELLTELRALRTAFLAQRLNRLAPEQRALLQAALPALEALVEED